MSKGESGKGIDRRGFIGRAGAGTAALLAVPGRLWGDPYAPGEPASRAPDSAAARPVRVRGMVQGERGRGLPGVAVSDGLHVEWTDDEGVFDLVSSTRESFVHVTLPAGYRIPLNPAGTARFYQPIQPDGRGEMEARFDLVPDRTDDRDHAFLLLADPQTQDERDMMLFHRETVPDARAAAASFGDVPAFGIGCGDLMWDDLSMLPDYERAAREIGIPFFQVLGNHDLNLDESTDEASSATFRSHFGPEHYSFDRGDVHYCVLDNVFWFGGGYVGYVSDHQLEWLGRDLSRVEAGRTVIVALHIPVGNSMERRLEGQVPVGYTTQNREALYRALEPYHAHLLSGHMHEKEHIINGSTHEQVNGAVCGAWWSGPIGWDGSPNGYGVYRVRGEEVSWQYKATGYPAEYQLRTYPHGAVPSRPDEIVANVWDWDPSWEVVWYEDGERKGRMRQEMGLDPLSVELHQGGDRPPRRQWVEPRNTDHMFYAPASPTAGEVLVEATDRFGRVFSAPVRARAERRRSTR